MAQLARPPRLCSEAGCSDPIHARGRCRYHYQDAKRQGTILRIRQDNQGKICEAPDCGRPATHKGYCVRHYDQSKTHGRVIETQFDRLQSTAEPATTARGKPVRALMLRGLQAFPLFATEEQRFLTPNGWRSVADLKVRDQIGYPIGLISKAKAKMPFRVPRPERGLWPSGPDTIEPSYELGRMLGLFLAEGSFELTPQRRPAAVAFALDRAEVTQVRSWLDALGGLYTSSRAYDQPGSNGSIITLSGRSLAQFVYDRCGATEEKRFPADWRDGGVAHARGLIHGYLFGDGHYARAAHQFGAVSKRVSLAVGLRDLLASLGYGWARIGYLPPNTYGPHSAQWRPLLCGSGADQLAVELQAADPASEKWSVLQRQRTVRNDVIIKDGHAWVPIINLGSASQDQLEQFRRRPDYLEVVGGFGVDRDLTR